jgi:dihydrofolate reductase
MGKTIVIQYITIDGVVEDPDGSDGTPLGGWAMRFGPEGIAGDKFRLGDMMTTGVLLFGRRTWDHFSELWPNRDSEFATAMNKATKAVLTNRPVDATAWSNSTAVPGDLAEWVRATVPDRDVVVIGSRSVVEALVSEDLVDEYRLITFPTAIGTGKKLFPAAASLELVSAERSGPGTLSTYTTR